MLARLIKVAVRKIGRQFVEASRPLVWRLANEYSIKIERHCFAHGSNPVEFEDSVEERRHNIPSSVYFNTGSGKIRVGKGTKFGYNVMLLTGKHASISDVENHKAQLHAAPTSGRDIIIGRNCWISSGAILIGPVKVGDYAVISAGAVVTRDVPERGLVVAPPGRLLPM